MRSRGALAVLLLPVLFCHARDTSNCTSRHKLCNGKYLCSDVCEIGSLVVDPWATASLAFQRALQLKEPVARGTFLGTHNSAISLAYGYGIEQDAIETLLNKSLFSNDDIGEGVDQNFALTDQLNIGLRHLEIDITSGYFKTPIPDPKEIFVCHTPWTGSTGGENQDKLIKEVKEAAKSKGIDLGTVVKDKFSCRGTNVPFRTMLQEVKTWMDKNPGEFVILFLDTKPLTVTNKGESDAASKVMRDVFGDWIHAKADGPILNRTIESLLADGKRLFFEDHDDGYNKADDVIVYTPDLWSHQFNQGEIKDYPDCAIQGDNHSWYTTVEMAQAGKANGLARGLYNRGSGLSVPVGDSGTPEVRQKAMQCGVGIVSPNYIQAGDMKDFVWSWAPGQPTPATSNKNSNCVVQGQTGRWSAVPCEEVAQCPLACRAASDDTNWTLAVGEGNAGAHVCGTGYIAVPPTNGFANMKLLDAAKAYRAAHALEHEGQSQSVWLNVSVDGRGPAPAW